MEIDGGLKFSLSEYFNGKVVKNWCSIASVSLVMITCASGTKDDLIEKQSLAVDI
jgi:hypothetical protein